MCIVVDSNAFHLVFDPKSEDHCEFKPVLDWLYDDRKTSLVMGGSKYRKEISRLHKYLSNLTELKRARKLSEIRDDVVDEEARRLESLVKHRDFDDAHLIAIFCASGCVLFASHNARADRFFKMKELYPKGQRRPHIYRSRKHIKLLCDRNIVSLRNTK